MADLAAGDERHPGHDRDCAGDAAGDPALPLLDLRPGVAAGRVSRGADGDGLGPGPRDLRRHPAPWHGRREPGMDRHLRAGATLLRLLPGDDFALLAAPVRLGPAVD